jgi:transcriptional regulator with XRE-family HTH domain
VPSKKSVANQALGRAIRSARIERGYSQESFARHAKMERSNFGAVERGEFNSRLDSLVRIAKALEMSLSELVGRAGL